MLLALVCLGADLPTTADACGACHPAEHDAWQRSGHAAAWTSPVFQASFRHWPDAWCLDCHAPGDQRTEIGRPVARGELVAPPGAAVQAGPAVEGVGCAACHLRDGRVLTAGKPTALGTAAHQMRHAPELADPEFCAACHEFTFPRHDTAAFVYGDQPLQRTWTEWQRWDGRETCQSCHMPDGLHGRDRQQRVDRLREAVHVEVFREGDGVAIHLSTRGVGHHLPTGDPFRRLVVEVCEDVACERIAGTAEASRRFRRTENTWTERADTTVPPGDGLTLRGPPGSAWQLWYALGDPAFHDRLPPEHVRVKLREGPVADSP